MIGMFAVVAVYPQGERILVGFAHTEEDVDGLIRDCIEYNGSEKIISLGVRFDVELAG